MRILAIDYGEKRIGLALSDPTGTIATPLTIIYTQKEADVFATLGRMVSERGVERIVVGMPRSLDGTIGPQAKVVLEFMARLAQSVPVPVVEWDETLTTVSADRLMRDKGKPKPGAKKVEVDSTAAAFILQGYLESLRTENRL